MEKSLEALRDAALGFANELRAVDGLQPVAVLSAGTMHSCAGDPVAVTAGGWRNGVAGWEIGNGGAIFLGPKGAVKRTVRVPTIIHEFSAAFDAGMFPDLIAREAVAA